MSLKSRRGSHNLKFGGQTIPDTVIRGTATANALSPIFRLVRRTIRLLLLDDLSDDREGSFATSQTGVHAPQGPCDVTILRYLIYPLGIFNEVIMPIVNAVLL